MRKLTNTNFVALGWVDEIRKMHKVIFIQFYAVAKTLKGIFGVWKVLWGERKDLFGE